jgi:predicted secreted protein
MSLVLGISLYLMIWWMTLFAVLPFGVRTQGESGTVVPGTPASAPSSPRLLRVFLINTIVAAVVFAIVWGGLEYDWLGLREAAPNAPVP